MKNGFMENCTDGRPRTRLDWFDATRGLNRGRSLLYEGMWYGVKCLFFLSPLPWPGSLRRTLLRCFGATIGEGVVVKPRVNIHFPWKLEVGDHVWIGEEVNLLNFEPIVIHQHACVSQRSFLCTGNHNYRDPSFSYCNAPIAIRAGAWVGAQAFVGPGSTIGSEAVVCAGSVVTGDIPPAMVCAGNPCKPLKPRWTR